MLSRIFRNRVITQNSVRFGPSLLFPFSEQQGGDSGKQSEITKENAQLIIDKWVKGNKVVLFMKGTPLAPMCGYSNFVVELLKKYGIFSLNQDSQSTSQSMFWTTPSLDKRSNCIKIGRPILNSTLTVNSLEVATSFTKCIKTIPLRNCSARKISSDYVCNDKLNLLIANFKTMIKRVQLPTDEGQFFYTP